MATEEEFREIIGGELDVDLSVLADVARHGIPEGVRGNVWKLLLGVTKPNKCTFPDFDLCLMLNVIAKKIGPATELELFRKHKEEYKELLSKEAFYNERRIRNQIRRYRRNVEVLKKEEVQESVAHVIHAYLVHEQQTETSLGLVYMAAPFVVCVEEVHEAFFCFMEMLKLVEEEFSGGLSKCLAHFMMMFRSVLPELYMHFEDEEVGPNEWAMGWLRTLLAQELPLHCVMRLWDTYLSCEEGLALHYYTCIAILAECSEELMDLEESELKGFLQHLPSLDMDKITITAYNFKGEIQVRGII